MRTVTSEGRVHLWCSECEPEDYPESRKCLCEDGCCCGCGKEEEMEHACECSRHWCLVAVKCEGCDSSPRDPHICEECEADPACNGEDLNPGYAEDEHSFLGPKL